MAEVKTAVIAFCKADSEILAMMGNRIHVDKIPDLEPYPHAELSLIANPTTAYHTKGRSGRIALVQVDLYGEDQATADSAANLLETKFDGYKGMMGANLYAGMTKARIITSTYNEETRKYKRILELEIRTND